ncbi:MAG: dihydrodipicolinate synthase family protein [Burkholderiales bacterium]
MAVIRSQGLAGVFVPVLTPFDSQLNPEPKRLVAHCRWLLAHGCNVLAVFGTTGEANSLSVTEREMLLEALLRGGVEPERLLPGTGCSALSDSVRLTAHAVKCGCAGALVLPPFYYKDVADEGLYRNYVEIIERVADPRLQLYLYHIPQVTKVGISLKLIERLLKAYPRIVVGMKDSSGDWDNTKATLDAFPGFNVLPGNERALLAAMRMGGKGCFTATGNIGAGGIHRLYECWTSTEADRMQEKVNKLHGVFQKYPMIAALKQVVADHSGDAVWLNLRPPLLGFDAHQAASLRQELELHGFSMPD